MVLIEECEVTAEYERGESDFVLEGAGTQTISVEGNIGVGLLESGDAEIHLVVGDSTIAIQDALLTSPDTPFIIETTLGDPDQNPVLPEPGESVPVGIFVTGVNIEDDVKTCGPLNVSTMADFFSLSCDILSEEAIVGRAVNLSTTVDNPTSDPQSLNLSWTSTTNPILGTNRTVTLDPGEVRDIQAGPLLTRSLWEQMGQPNSLSFQTFIAPGFPQASLEAAVIPDNVFGIPSDQFALTIGTGVITGVITGAITPVVLDVATGTAEAAGEAAEEVEKEVSGG